jgi:DNA replication and repair protein RecF
VPVEAFSARDFRCLQAVEFEADARYNLIFGANGSGKTSILEALGYLGRGKSFRGATAADLVRHGQQEFVLFGKVRDGGHTASLGVKNGAGGLEIRVDGHNEGAAALATALPMQVIDPDVHELVAGAPERRRRYLDWLAFHVEPGFLETWRRFRKALRQRNAALKGGATGATMKSWDREFTPLAEALDAGRRQALAVTVPALEEAGRDLLGSELRFEYRAGWSEGAGLAALLESGLERDRQLGSTQAGPHRADLRLLYDERQARRLVSRGQQKLLACAMILAATETAQTELERPLLLLLDDPAAELDADALRRLMARIAGLGCQVVATSLEPDTSIFDAGARVFHVEQGVLAGR